MPVFKYRDNQGNIKELPLIVPMDSELDATSERGVQNKVVKAAVEAKSTVSGTDDGSNWTTITIDGITKTIPAGGSAAHTDLDLPIDLSSYSENDVIPTTIITKLKEHRAHIKVLYGGIQYAISNITEDATGLEGIVLNGLDIADDSYLVKVLLIIKAAGSSDYKLDTVGGIDVATYIEGALTIKLDSENKFTLVTNNGVGINIYKNNSQADLIDLTLPATSGTLATTADATVTSQKVIDALGYTPYNKAAGGIPRSDLASDVQTSLSKADNAAEKATAVTNVAYDTTNKKLTKTINGTTSDVVTVAKIKTDLNLAKGDVGLGNADNKSSATIRSEITSANVTDALGYTPYNSTNPSGYISGIDGTMVKTALGYTPYNATNPEGYISGITGPMVNSALGYVPYDSANPSGYISSYTVTQSDVTNALGYVPYNSTNPNNYISGISGTDVTTALGYVPYNSTNPNGYITGISSSDVTAALGYTPYNSSNPNNYIDATTNSLNNYYTKTAVDGMVANRFQAKIVQTLPASGISTSTIYMVLQTGQQNIYDEYMYIENTWVKIGTTSIDMSEYAKTADLHNVALTGAYSSLVGKPTIPANTSDLTNDSGFITNTANNLQNYTKTDDLAPVAITNSYNDLLNKPSVPTSTSQLTNDSGFLTNTNLSQTNISTFINNVPYATLNDVRGLEDIDVEEIKKAIAAMEHIGTVTQVTGGTGLTGSGNTTVTINHSNSVVANTSWPSGTSSPENGGKFNVRDVKYDTEGHVTSYQDREITLPFIPSYDDTTVRGLISDETAARTATDARVTALENFNVNTFTSFVFCIFGIEPYIDPETMQIVPNRYYQRSDVDTGIYMDNEKVDVHLKAWLKYHYNIDDLANLRNITCYVYAMGDHGEYVNHMVTFWSQRTNPKIMNYPHLQQVGSFIDDGYGSVRRFTATQIGAILSSTDDGYIQADPLGTGKGFVTGWSSLTDRVTAAETAITGKQDTLTAGTNISISGATISADDQVDVVSGTTPANSVQIWIDNSEHYAELDDPEIVQVPGQSTMKVMSQKAVTDEINNHVNDASVHTNATEKATWSAKQDPLVAGVGIDITGNVISSVSVSSSVKQDIGTSTIDVMSQNATTNQIKYLDNMVETYALDSIGQAACYIPDVQVADKYVKKVGTVVTEYTLAGSKYAAIPLDTVSYFSIKYNNIATTSEAFSTSMAVIAQGSTAGSTADDWMSYSNIISGWNQITTYKDNYAVFNSAKIKENFPSATYLLVNMLTADCLYKVIYTESADIATSVSKLKEMDGMLVPSGANIDSSYFYVDTSTGWVSVVGIIDVYYGIGGQYRRFQNAENVCQITGVGTAAIIYKPSTHTFYYGENQTEGVVVATTRGKNIYPKGNVTVKYSDNSQLKTLQKIQEQVDSISYTAELDAWLVSPNAGYISVNLTSGSVSIVGIVDIYYGPGGKFKRLQNVTDACTITGAGSSTLLLDPTTGTVTYGDSKTSGVIIATTFGKQVYVKGAVDVVYSDGTRVKANHNLATQVTSNTDRIESLETGGGNLPTFAKSAALETYQRILSWAGDDQICMIAQVTDVHSAGSEKYKAVGYLNEINSLYGFDLLGNFGDIGLDTTSETTETGCALISNTKMKMKTETPWVFLKGNHDSGRVLQLSDSAVSNIFEQPFAKQHSNMHESGKCYGYVDLENSKIRVVYLNTSDNILNSYAINATQLTWLASTLAAVQAGWNVVVLSHLCVDDCGRWASYPGDASGAGFDTLRSILAAFVSKTAGSNSTTGVSWDFTSVPATCKLVCSFAGDSHFNNTAVTNNVRYIVRQGYGSISASEIATGGTTDSFDYTSQVLFDVLCIKSSGTAKVFRIGAGGSTRDLEFSF